MVADFKIYMTLQLENQISVIRNNPTVIKVGFPDMNNMHCFTPFINGKAKLVKHCIRTIPRQITMSIMTNVISPNCKTLYLYTKGYIINYM